MTDEAKPFRADCPDCKGERNMIVRATYIHDWEDGDRYNSVNGRVECRIIECAGCGSLIYHRRDNFSEEWDVEFDPRTGAEEYIYPWKVDTYPRANAKSAPDWLRKLRDIDPLLFEVLGQVYRTRFFLP